MSPLRQQMIEAMQVRGFSPRTHQSYLAAVTALARFHRRSPDTLDVPALEAFFKHLAIDRQLSGATCRLMFNGIRFLYLRVLGWAQFDVPIAMPKKAQRIPELLTRAEVGRLIQSLDNTKHRMLLTLCYGCGLRVSELVAIQVHQIDGERRLLRVEQGKGAKDRVVIVSQGLLDGLRRYWHDCRPRHWLFPSSRPTAHLSVSAAQRIYGAARRSAGLKKVGGIHSLRHAYATHQLEEGLPVHLLQRQLGHSTLSSTLRYLHWVPRYREGQIGQIDLIAGLERAS